MFQQTSLSNISTKHSLIQMTSMFSKFVVYTLVVSIVCTMFNLEQAHPKEETSHSRYVYSLLKFA